MADGVFPPALAAIDETKKPVNLRIIRQGSFRFSQLFPRAIVIPGCRIKMRRPGEMRLSRIRPEPLDRFDACFREGETRRCAIIFSTVNFIVSRRG